MEEPLIDQVELAVRYVLSVTQAGGMIFTGCRQDGTLVRVVANPKTLSRLPRVGETWLVTGTCSCHPQHGRQMRASVCTHRVPRGRLIVNYIAGQSEFKGIGEAKALRLYSYFGDNLARVLDAGDLDKLKEVLSQVAAERVISGWAKCRSEAMVVDFLDSYGFDARLAGKLQHVWGDRAMDMLKLNPYLMLAFSSWRTVDRAARKIGIANDDSRRQIGAVESVLYERLQQGHTLMSATDLESAVAQRLRLPSHLRAIPLALAEGAIVGNKYDGYQPSCAAALERAVERRLHDIGITGVSQAKLPLTEPLDQWFDKSLDEVGAEQRLSLNTEQKTAVRLALTCSLALIIGGAGVGKTTVLMAVTALAERMKVPVVQMALTGRAAARLAQATQRPAMTIARFLAQVKGRQLDVTRETLVVIDESSMIDLPTVYQVLRCLPDGTRLLFVGDPAQLPPIGFGLVFHRLVECTSLSRTVLRQVHRQAANTGIPDAAALIRQRNLPKLDNYQGQHRGVSLIECAPEGVIPQLFMLEQIWRGDDWRILAATYSGPSGIDAINNSLFEHLADGRRLPGFRFAVGVPVVHLVNDYERGLMNGALGQVSGVEDGSNLGLRVDFDGQEHFFSVAEVTERLSLAYAISVHKAQGSQFRKVAVIATSSRLLDNALVYTALTRGVEQVIFIGSGTTLEAAVRAPAAVSLRQVAFAL